MRVLNAKELKQVEGGLWPLALLLLVPPGISVYEEVTGEEVSPVDEWLGLP